uniref:Uncharacterized protein n=1 Tax=Plectus sambesii TaxID=2011161 RepID=A0A914V0N1_9BILA
MAASLAASRKLIERLLPNRAPSFEPSRPRSKIRRGRHYEDAEAAYEAAMANQEVEEERERRQAEGLEDSSSLHVLDESDLRELERKRQQKLKFDLIKEQIAIQQKRVDAEMDRMPDFNPAHDEMPTFRLSSGSTDPFDDSSLVEETRHQSRGPCVDISNSNGGEQLSPLGSPISGDAKHVPRRSARLSTVSDIEHVKHAELITSSTPIKDKKDREQDREDESTDPPVVAQSISAQSVSAQSVSAQSISAQSDLASTAETDQENQTPIEVDSVAEETPEEEEIRPKQSPKASPASVTKVKKTVEGKEKEKEREQAAADEIRSPVSKRSKGRGSTSSSATPPSPSPTIRPLSSSKFVGTPRPSGTPNVLLRSVLHKATMERVTRFAPTTPRVNSTLLIARAPPKSGTSRRTRASVFSGVVK